MILCHAHRFIFLKTNKTAGTSVEIALSRVCGENDILTPISQEDERIRADLGFAGARNHLLPEREYGLADRVRRLLTRRPVQRYYNHVPAREVLRHLGPDTWNGYFTFCFERNPWDRVVSMYFWKTRKLPEHKRPPLGEFLDSPKMQLLLEKGRGVYTLDGQVAVDRVCRFEHLDEELESVRQTLGIDSPLEIPRTKAGFRKDRKHYRDILTMDERDRIAEMFRFEIELMGYEY